MKELDGIKVKSLHRALVILEYFDRDNPERGISEIVRASGMLKSTVYNIVSTFTKCGYLEKNPATGKYRLGTKILELSNVFQNSDEKPKILKPYMDRLAEECNETVYFAIPAHTEAIYIYSAHPKGMTFTRSIVGVKVKLYCTGVGKAMLAHCDENILSQVIADGLQPFTNNTITNENDLRADLEQIRRRGYAIDNMEHEYGISCVSVPVININDGIVGSLSISGPSLRIDEKIELFSSLLINTANEVKMLLK